MSNTALAAQGTTLQISSTSGSAKTISGVTVGNPTILTVTANGLTNGDIGTIAGLTGADAALLNGYSGSVMFVTTNTLAIPIDTTGKTITAGSGTITPVQWATVGNVKSYSAMDGKRTILDVSNLSSTGKEKISGLLDAGSFSFEIDQDNSDAGQTKLYNAWINGVVKTFKLTLPNANALTFTAIVTNWPSSSGVDQIVKRSVTLEITGVPVWA